MYIIRLNQGDYYEERGGYDWGRTNQGGATRFDNMEEAQRIADWLKPFGAEIEDAY